MYLSKISSQVHKLHELVNYLLDVSKVQAGKMQFVMEEIAVDRFVADVVRDVQQITPSHRFRIEGKTEAHIRIDKDRIRQVVVNILNNAVKYSSHADSVIVTLARVGPRIRISVTDFGIGIPKEKRDKIFDRFYQVNDAKGYTYSGMGLGLYISKDIIGKHNGTLFVESEEGKGSTFHVELPISKYS
jgi:signal transduction histidine kinase